MRTLLIYRVLVLALRIFGKWLTGQITLIEMAVILTMGAILAPAMPWLTVACWLDHRSNLRAGLKQGINYKRLKRPNFERLI